MTKYVLRHNNTPYSHDTPYGHGRAWFVARPGSKQAYTSALQDAQTFQTREEAEKNRCIESEHIVSLEALLGGR